MGELNEPPNRTIERTASRRAAFSRALIVDVMRHRTPGPFTLRKCIPAMLAFLDTEFTQIQQPELISVGLVSELGHEFYAELSDFPRDKCSEFVHGEVLPLFGRVAGALCSKSELARRLPEWFHSLGERTIVIFDYDVDWELLSLAFRFDGGSVPTSIDTPLCLSGLIVTDPVYQDAFNRSLSEVWPRHHALADARAIHAGYRALILPWFHVHQIVGTF
jgi:hypothetical protein